MNQEICSDEFMSSYMGLINLSLHNDITSRDEFCFLRYKRVTGSDILRSSVFESTDSNKLLVCLRAWFSRFVPLDVLT